MTANTVFIFLITILSFVAFQNCANVKSETPAPSASVTAQGSRKLGLHITQPQGEAFTTTFNLVLADKFNHTNMHQIWGPGTFMPASLPVTPFVSDAAGTVLDFAILDTANAFYPANNMPVMLTIGTIDTNNKFVPANFNATSFDDIGLRNSFKTMLTNMMPHLTTTQLVSLQIGNEVDVLLGTNATAWAQYKTFFDDVAAHARTLKAGLKVGVTVTLAGAINPAQQAFVQSLMSTADIISVTYYPMNSDFTMKSPSVVSADITSLVNIYGTKPIYFQEVGYSSGSISVASSEEQQKQFVASFFTVWDTYATKIPVVSWLNYSEWSTATVDGYGTQYGVCPGTYCASFKEFLQTLGLRNYTSGTAKPALTELRSQMTSRSWVF